MIDQIEHGHHVFRAYWKHAFLKQYEKFSRYLRNELVSNNLHDFGLKKGLDHLDAARKKFQAITDRFAGFQAQSLNVHVDFPLLQRLALPATIGSVRVPGIKIQDTRTIRLLEVLLHGGNTVGGSTAKQIHEAVLATFQLSPKQYGLNQLRYDLRKLKGHGLLERDGRRYAYRLTAKACRSRCCFCSFTSDSAARWPTAASTTNPTRPADRTANWKPPTTRPTRPLRTSLTCYKPPDVTACLLNYFCLQMKIEESTPDSQETEFGSGRGDVKLLV